MAQFLTFSSLLLLIALFKPIVCPTSKTLSERRDRSLYIESSEYGPQYLSVTIGSQLKHNKEQSTTPAHNLRKISPQKSKDSIFDENIRRVFSTNFGPGLHLFSNTAPFVNEPQYNPYNDQMVGDQPDPNLPPSLPSSTDKKFFKVQRNPDGKLSVVYNESYVSKDEREKLNNVPDKQTRNSNNQNSANRYQTHFADGLPLKNEKSEKTLPTAYDANTSENTADSLTQKPRTKELNECLEKDFKNKTYCSRIRHYPRKDHLEELIKNKFQNFESFFGEDLVVPDDIGQRMNNDPNEEYLCRSQQVVIYPQSAQNKDYQWIYIVNSDKFKQGIRIEECIDPHTATCGTHTGLTLPNHYTATCEQHYIYRSLVAYQNDTIFKETFRLPACCKCVLRTHPSF